jgi:hypothetical protein
MDKHRTKSRIRKQRKSVLWAVSASLRLLNAATASPKLRQVAPRSVRRVPNVRLQGVAARRPNEIYAAGFGNRRHSPARLDDSTPSMADGHRRQPPERAPESPNIDTIKLIVVLRRSQNPLHNAHTASRLRRDLDHPQAVST